MVGTRRAVVEFSWPWWEAEFEIGFRAFQATGIYSQTGWLAHQIAKEWHGSGVYGPRGTDLGQLTAGEASANATEELAHFHALRALGETMDVAPGRHRPGPAACALTEYRNARWDNSVARHGVRMSEGGGLGMLHGAIAAIDARSAERAQDGAVRACFRAIIADEAGHLGGAVDDYVALTLSPKDDELVRTTLAGCLSLKVEERREQFASQLGVPAALPGRAEIAAYRAAIEGLIL